MILTIQNITDKDYGNYNCVASNTMGKAEESVRLYGKCEIAPSSK